MSAPIPENEAQRLQALAQYRILDSGPEPEYAELARAAASIFEAPIGMVGFVDAQRVWIKAAAGTALTEVPRDVSLCSHTIAAGDLVAIPDASVDSRFRNSPLVTGGPRFRFHVSAPLVTPEGFIVGALSVADSVPRTPAGPQCEALRALASQVVSQLEFRRVRQELGRARELQKGILAASRDCIKVLDLSGRLLYVNEGGLDALEITDIGPFLDRFWVEFWQGEDREAARAAVAGALEGRTSRFTGYFPTVASQEPRWWDVVVSPIRNASGEPGRILAVSRDVTERHRAEEIFQALVMGTASSTGADFFPSLVEHLSRALGARYAFVAECDNQKDARVLAFWKDGSLGRPFEFVVTGTPCERVARGETCHYARDLQSAFPDNGAIAALGAESYLGLPAVDSTGKVIGHMVVMHDKPILENPRAFDLIRIFAARAAAEMKRRRAEAELQAALEQVKALQQKLEAENLYLQEEIQTEHNFEEIVGRSPALIEVLQKVEAVAPTDSTVLIVGESGCGKELIARAIHSRSRRKQRPLVKLNCGAIPTGLVESELFGHVRGAFTGALEKRIGRFELADGGTLFLDEVGELPLDIQVKLLRVLQEREFEPLGSSRTIRVNVRIVAATNRDLAQAVRDGRFRADLYYRLNVLPVVLPPLRERRSDIPLLASFFVDRLGRQFGKEFTGITSDTMAVLSSYDWPGNIRELQNIIERALVLSPGPILKLGRDLLPVAHAVEPAEDRAPSTDGRGTSLEGVERTHIVEILCACGWVIEGSKGAARILELHPNTLRSRMKKLGIVRPHC